MDHVSFEEYRRPVAISSPFPDPLPAVPVVVAATGDVGCGELSCALAPMGAVRQVRSDAWKGRPAVVRYRAYRDALREAAASQNFIVPETLELNFTIPMPVSWSKKRQAATNGEPHKSKPDNDNLTKGFLDALLLEDSHIHTVLARKKWGYEGLIRARPLSDEREG